VLGRQIVPRNRFGGYRLLYVDYFVDEPVFNDDVFRRWFVFIHYIFSQLINDKLTNEHFPLNRFRMTKDMFIDICHDVAKRNSYFQRTSNAVGLLGFATIQKVTMAIRILGYGGSADRLDEYIRMGESTTLLCFASYSFLVLSSIRCESGR
jgi:hypothetical protein